MSKPLVSADPVYQKIQQYYNENGAKINIKQLFDSDPKRFEKFSLTLKTPNDGDILLVSVIKHVVYFIIILMQFYITFCFVFSDIKK